MAVIAGPVPTGLNLWVVDRVVKVVDGDTLHLEVHSDPVLVSDDMAQTFYSAKPWKCRLITVDTPERGEAGHLEAGAFCRTWLAQRDGAVCAETYHRDAFGRRLTDVYIAGDRTDTLSQALLREGYATYDPKRQV